MKKVILSILVAGIVGSGVSVASDNTAVESTLDVNKNPITGTVTKKTKRSKKIKNRDGSAQEETTTDSTAVKKDGTVERKQETDSKSSPADKKE